MKPVLGTDVSKAKLDIAPRLADGEIHTKIVADNPKGFTELTVWLSKYMLTELHLCMEATGIYREGAAEYPAEAWIHGQCR